MNAPAAIATAYDVEAIRRDFPILSREVYGKPLVYLDNGASAQKPQAVIDAVDARLHARNTPTSIAGCISCRTPRPRTTRRRARPCAASSMPRITDEIIFTRNADRGDQPRRRRPSARMAIGEGDEIVLSIMEHHSNIVPWHFHRERKGAVIKWAPVADDGTFLLDEFEKLLTPRTKIVAITHMSNVLGTVVPIKEVCRIAHARGIPVLVDGSQGAVHLPVDVQDLDCDFYVLHRPQGLRPDRHRRPLRQARAADGDAALHGRRRDDPRRDRGHASPMPTRRTASRRARRRSSRRSGSARRSTTWKAIGRERIAAHEAELARLRPRAAARDQQPAHLRHAPDKGAIVAFNMAGRPPARRLDGHRPRGRGGARRHALRPAAARPLSA